MEKIRIQHLHENDSSALHFEVKDAKRYLALNQEFSYTPHRQSYYQIIWFKNAGRHSIDNQLIEHDENAVLLIDVGQVHYFDKHSSNEGLLFHFNEAFLKPDNLMNGDWILNKLFNELKISILQLDEESVSKIQLINGIINTELDRKYRHYKYQVRLLFFLILLTIERMKVGQESKAIKVDPDFGYVVTFRNLIDEHIGDMISIDQYCQKLDITPKKLSALTKKYLGQSAAEVIRSRKLLEAKRLLLNTSLTVKQVANQLGFEQATYFTKFFKKYTGTTPKKYGSQP